MERMSDLYSDLHKKVKGKKSKKSKVAKKPKAPKKTSKSDDLTQDFKEITNRLGEVKFYLERVTFHVGELDTQIEKFSKKIESKRFAKGGSTYAEGGGIKEALDLIHLSPPFEVWGYDNSMDENSEDYDPFVLLEKGIKSIEEASKLANKYSDTYSPVEIRNKNSDEVDEYDNLDLPPFYLMGYDNTMNPNSEDYDPFVVLGQGIKSIEEALKLSNKHLGKKYVITRIHNKTGDIAYEDEYNSSTYAEGGEVTSDQSFEIWEENQYGDNSPLSDNDRWLWTEGYRERHETNITDDNHFYEWEENQYGDDSPLSDNDRIIWQDGFSYIDTYQ
jgi:hypothetical protein